MLGDVLVSSDIEVSELGMEVESLYLNSLSVLFKDFTELLSLRLGNFEVLLSSEGSVINGYGSNLGEGVLLDSSSGECRVDVSDEIVVVEHSLSI